MITKTSDQNILIGLTGGIASGKSTAAAWFREQGIPVVDADELARRVVQPGQPTLEKLVSQFGNAILTATGELHREVLAQIIFNDEQKRKALNAITHPAIALEAQKDIAAAFAQGHRMVVYDVPLLFENKLENIFDATIVVAVDEATQIQRLMQRNQLDEKTAKQRIASQMPLRDKMSKATYVVDNNGSQEALMTQLQDLLLTL